MSSLLRTGYDQNRQRVFLYRY